MISLRERYDKIRNHSLNMVKCLEDDREFYGQSVQEVSPPSWNLGHTTWFFDAVVLGKYARSLGGKDGKLWYHFNSYYKGAGKHIRQACRGAILINEISLDSIYKYRKDVDEVMQSFLDCDQGKEFADLVVLGINHEQQHQELFYAEVLRTRFGHRNGDSLKFFESSAREADDISLEWVHFDEAITEIGNVEGGFGFDNKYGVHKEYINPFSMMNRPVTNREFLEFIEDGGYEDFAFWLAEAWDDSSMQAS